MPPIRLIHVTDPHLTSLAHVARGSLRGKRWSGYLSWRRKRQHLHRREVLDAVTEAVRSEEPDQILVTGDLVHIGLPEEIETAKAWLERLGSADRVMLVPGNHDVYARDSWAAVEAYWGPYLSANDRSVQASGDPREHGQAGFPVLRRLGAADAPVNLIGVSTALPSALFMADGRLGAAQLARLEAVLAAAEGFRCLLIHHPPLPGMTHRRKALADAPALAETLGRQGAELALHGHVHENVSGRGPGDMAIYGTASASSASARTPACYRRFDLTPTAAGWRVEMVLIAVNAAGETAETARECWGVAVRPASGTSAEP